MIRVAVRVHPNARTERIDLQADGSLEIWVRAVPRDGRANQAMLEAVARQLGLRPREVRLVQGGRTRRKLLEVDLASAAQLVQRLASPPSSGES